MADVQRLGKAPLVYQGFMSYNRYLVLITNFRQLYKWYDNLISKNCFKKYIVLTYNKEGGREESSPSSGKDFS